MRIKTTSSVAPSTIKDTLLTLEAGGSGLEFSEVNVASVRATVQKLRQTYRGRRYQTRTEGGAITVWRLADQPK